MTADFLFLGVCIIKTRENNQVCKILESAFNDLKEVTDVCGGRCCVGVLTVCAILTMLDCDAPECMIGLGVRNCGCDCLFVSLFCLIFKSYFTQKIII